MATVNIDVDLVDFDLDEILDELKYRYKSGDKKDKQVINDFIKIMKMPLDKISILDKIKIDLFTQNLNKISLDDLEKIIN